MQPKQIQLSYRQMIDRGIFFAYRARGPFQHHSRSDKAHLHMRIAEIKRVCPSARILPIHVKERVKRG